MSPGHEEFVIAAGPDYPKSDEQTIAELLAEIGRLKQKLEVVERREQMLRDSLEQAEGKIGIQTEFFGDLMVSVMQRS